METYISLLRGINVSGHNPIKMDRLVALYTSLGLGNVKTYVQSGNAVFASSEVSASKLSKAIEDAILSTFGFPVSVLTRTKDELDRIVSKNPFLDDPSIDTKKLNVTFMSHAPAGSISRRMEKIPDNPDSFVISGTEIYLHCPNGYGRTKLSNSFFERKFNTIATTRNWNTVSKLLHIAEALG